MVILSSKLLVSKESVLFLIEKSVIMIQMISFQENKFLIVSLLNLLSKSYLWEQNHLLELLKELRNRILILISLKFLLTSYLLEKKRLKPLVLKVSELLFTKILLTTETILWSRLVLSLTNKLSLSNRLY